MLWLKVEKGICLGFIWKIKGKAEQNIPWRCQAALLPWTKEVECQECDLGMAQESFLGAQESCPSLAPHFGILPSRLSLLWVQSSFSSKIRTHMERFGKKEEVEKGWKAEVLGFCSVSPVVEVSSSLSVLAFQKSSLGEGNIPPLGVYSRGILEESPGSLRTLWLQSSTWSGSDGKIKFRRNWLFHSDVSQQWARSSRVTLEHPKNYNIYTSK